MRHLACVALVLCISAAPARAIDPVEPVRKTHEVVVDVAEAAHGAGVREGGWSAQPDFCYWDFPLVELDGLTMGIVGLGRIGRATAALARAFGMRVLATGRTGLPDEEGIRGVDLQTLLGESAGKGDKND